MTDKTVCDECGDEIVTEFGGQVYHQVTTYHNGYVEDSHYCNDCVMPERNTMIEVVKKHLPW